jgi:3-deoxy-D-manno-octulosonic-acid transferase
MNHLYALLATLAAPALLHPRLRAGAAERLMRTTAPRCQLWIQAASAGECRLVAPLVAALPAPLKVLATATTTQGRDFLASCAPQASARGIRLTVRHQPWDHPALVGRLLDQAAPKAVVLLETELWPQLLAGARAAGVPMVLANARLSERSLAKALRYEALVRQAACAFVRVAAQSDADRARIAKLYDGRIDVIGNLKFDLTPSAEQVERGVIARAALGRRPVWLFASSREGEEVLVLDAFKDMQRKLVSDPIFLIVPRHPQRFDEVARLIEARGFLCARRSQGALAREAPENAVLLGDSMGEMAMYYAAADVALIGGSLLPFGAQNLIEACAVGTPVILGPSTFNFAQAAADALAAGAAIQVENAAQALAAMDALCRDGARREAMRRAALAFAAAHRGATARTVALIEEVLGAVSAPAAR